MKLKIRLDTEMEKQREINQSLMVRYDNLSQKFQSVDSEYKSLSQKLHTFDERIRRLEGSSPEINLVNQS